MIDLNCSTLEELENIENDDRPFASLRPHLHEIKCRLKIVSILFVIFFAISFWQYSPILDWIVEPLQDALSVAKETTANGLDGKVTTHQVAGTFFVILKVAFFATFILLIPVFLWHGWGFIAPGLNEKEKKFTFPLVVGGTFMFAVGILFAYYIVMPFGFEFLILFGSEKFVPYIDIENYVGFFTKFGIGFGIAFQLPVIIFFLAHLGFVTDKDLKDFFKYAILIIFIISAILTPPDVLTQLLMAGPMTLLYGISILIAKTINPFKKDE
ncbi:twin arginine targeting protein translocase subunit TatC [Thiovulum sp. ES]|nr:twin arginine targeting protein translocase subunit TatC [Thiovulum sp. ES]